MRPERLAQAAEGAAPNVREAFRAHSVVKRREHRTAIRRQGTASHIQAFCPDGIL
jgi:hypothetical protein